jgi:hypothetical protein
MLIASRYLVMRWSLSYSSATGSRW